MNESGSELWEDIILEEYIINEDGHRFLTELELKLIQSLIKHWIYSEEIVLKLFSNLRIDPIRKCWFRTRDWSQYSQINIGNKKMRGAHSISYELFNGPLKFNMETCHTCDRRGCINPNHLFQGTHSDNMKDAFKKHRAFTVNPGKRRHNNA